MFGKSNYKKRTPKSASHNNRKNQQHVQGQSQQQQNLKPQGIYDSPTSHVSNTSRTFVTLFNIL